MRALCLLLLLAGCSDDSSRLRVDLKTDLVGGFEFTTFELELHSQRPRRLGEGEAYMLERVQRDFFAPDERLGTGFDVHEFEVDDLPNADPWYLRARFFASNGTLVAEQVTAVQLAGKRTAATMLVTRDCAGISCPLAGGDASAIACLRGMCVDPRCPQDPSFCPMPECAADADCLDFNPPAVCGMRQCIESYCLALSPERACGAMEWCNPDQGCTSTSFDAGVSCVMGERCTPRECEIGFIDCSLGGPTGTCVSAGVEFEGVACTGGSCDGMGACVP